MTSSFHTSVHPESNTNTQPTVKPERNRLKKRVLFADPAVDIDNNKRLERESLSSTTSQTNPPTQTLAMVNLKAIKSVCCHMKSACSQSTPCADACLGYLENVSPPQSFKLVFYDAYRRNSAHSLQPKFYAEAYPISSLLQRLQILQQLTLAHKVAMATLQYHSTFWLPLDWSLQDIAYFDNTGQPSCSVDTISQQMSSLHLSTKFQWKIPEAALHSSQSPEDLKYMYGIRNIALAKLGVALIEICSKQDIRKLTTNPVPHDVISARKILLEKPPYLEKLGMRYIEIARKCIDCDFSCGDDLNKDDLQSAVYTEVVCALEEMIRHWKGFFGR